VPQVRPFKNISCPIAALFVAFFVAPHCVLILLSLRQM
jgi:hypothetical protein